MTPELTGASIVVVVSGFDPTPIRPPWLTREGHVREDEVGPASVFAPQVSLVDAPAFQLMAVPQRVQFVPRDPADGAMASTASRVLGGVADLISPGSFRAVGLNFTWQWRPGELGVAEPLRSLFWKPGVSLFDCLDGPDARCGGYISCDRLGVRLRLTVRPIKTQDAEDPDERIQFVFNYNRDVGPSDSGPETVRSAAARWSSALEDSRAVLEVIPR